MGPQMASSLAWITYFCPALGPEPSDHFPWLRLMAVMWGRPQKTDSRSIDGYCYIASISLIFTVVLTPD
jgi:hypothetical protein